MEASTESTAVHEDDVVAAVAPRRTRIDHGHPTANSLSETPSQTVLAEGADLPEPLANTDEQPLLEVEEPTAEMLAAVAGQNPEIRREQLQLQVSQLAGHLRERLREVDRREATLNARVAQLESDLRASRMWIREREIEFQDREKELHRQIEELQEKCASRTVREEAEVFDREAVRAELAECERQLQLREDELRERRFEVDRQAVALRHSQQLWQQQYEREQRELIADRERDEQTLSEERAQLQQQFDAQVAEREAQLRTAELLLSEHAEQLERDRAALTSDRTAWDEHQARQRQAIDELRSTAEQELSDRRTRLAARQEWIERQKTGLEQVRDEALRLHRQSIEMRLLAEQLWSQITGSLTPAEVTQAIAQLRLKLSDQYRIEEQQLVSRRDELLELSERIAAQHRELEQLKLGVRQWAAARQTEIEQQAASLVERELVLDDQQEHFRQAQQGWNSDRRRYEQQIRDLTCQLRTLPVAA